MALAASSTDLKTAFEEHLTQTQRHIERVGHVLSMHGHSGGNVTCMAMQGLLAEGDELMQLPADPAVIDAGLIAAAQRVEHYETAGYGCVRTWAQLLGYEDSATTLQLILDEEAKTDQKLTDIATHSITRLAAR